MRKGDNRCQAKHKLGNYISLDRVGKEKEKKEGVARKQEIGKGRGQKHETYSGKAGLLGGRQK